MPPGLHSLSISKPGWDSISESIEIKLGERLEKEYRMNQQTGGFRFSVSPLDAYCTLNDIKGKVMENWQGLKFINKLPVGEYTINISAEEYISKVLDIKIINDKIQDVNVNLLKGESLPKVEENANMVFVKGGIYRIGSTSGGLDEKPIHAVTLRDYYIGKYEVTQALYKDITRTNPSSFSGDDHPVEKVS